MIRSAAARSAVFSWSDGWQGERPDAGAPGRDGQVEVRRHGAHERLESLFLDRLAHDERMARAEEQAEVSGGDVQVRKSVADCGTRLCACRRASRRLALSVDHGDARRDRRTGSPRRGHAILHAPEGRAPRPAARRRDEGPGRRADPGARAGPRLRQRGGESAAGRRGAPVGRRRGGRELPAPRRRRAGGRAPVGRARGRRSGRRSRAPGRAHRVGPGAAARRRRRALSDTSTGSGAIPG